MSYIDVTVSVDADEVLGEISTEDLVEELESRRKDDTRGTGADSDFLLRQVYEHYLVNGGAPPCLREYLWQVYGRVV